MASETVNLDGPRPDMEKESRKTLGSVVVAAQGLSPFDTPDLTEQNIEVAENPKDALRNTPEEVTVGFRGWLNVFGIFMIGTVCYGMTNTFGAFQEYYSNNQLSNYPPTTISWIGSAQLCLVLLMGCISGPLFDMGYLHSLVIIGGIVYVFCLMMTSIAHEFYQFFLAQGLGVGIAMGFIFAPALSTIGHHFRASKYRSLAFGIFAGGASVGGAVFPVMLRKLITEVGFAWAVRVLAFVVLFCFICGSSCLSTTLPPRRNVTILSFSVFKDPAYSLVVLGAGMVAVGLYGPISFAVTYAEAHGLPASLAYDSLASLNACSFVGRIAPNAIAGRVGPINVLIASCFLSSIMIFLWTMAKAEPNILAFNILYGIVSGAYVSALPAGVTSLNKDASKTGLCLGMMFFATSLFWLGCGPITGRLIINNDYLPASMFGGTVVMVGVLILLAGRRVAVRNAGTPWV